MKNALRLTFILLFTCSAIIAQDRQLAKQYLLSGDYEKAVSLYESVFEKTQSTSVYQEYLKCLLELRDFKEAEKVAKTQHKRDRLNPIFLVDLGYTYKLQEKEDKMEDAYADAIKLLNQNPTATVNLANQFQKYQELDWALKAFMEGRKVLPGANYNLQIAEIYAAQENMEMFFNEYLDLLEINRAYLQTVKNRIRRIISDDPSYAANQTLKSLLIKKIQGNQDEIYVDLLTWLFIQEKNFDQAFVQLRAIDKRLESGERRIFNLGRIAKNNQAYDAALKCYQYLIDKGTDCNFYLDAKVNKLQVLQDKILLSTNYGPADLKELENSYKSTLKEFGGNRQSLLLIRDLAHLEAFYLNKPDTAQTMLEEALESNTTNPQIKAELKLELADVYLMKGLVWESILLYGQVEKSFKEAVIGQEAKFRRARVYYFTGDFGFALGQLDVLKASTSKLIANDAMKLSLLINDNLALDTSTEALSMYARADLLSYRKQYTAALSALDSLIKIHIANDIIDEAYFKKAEVLTKLKSYQAAADILEELVQSYGYGLFSDDSYFLLGTLYEEQLNNKEKAMEAYKELMVKFPGSVYTVEARNRFRSLRGDQLKPAQ